MDSACGRWRREDIPPWKIAGECAAVGLLQRGYPGRWGELANSGAGTVHVSQIGVHAPPGWWNGEPAKFGRFEVRICAARPKQRFCIRAFLGSRRRRQDHWWAKRWKCHSSREVLHADKEWPPDWWRCGGSEVLEGRSAQLKFTQPGSGVRVRPIGKLPFVVVCG